MDQGWQMKTATLTFTRLEIVLKWKSRARPWQRPPR